MYADKKTRSNQMIFTVPSYVFTLMRLLFDAQFTIMHAELSFVKCYGWIFSLSHALLFFSSRVALLFV